VSAGAASADLPPGYRVTRFYTIARRFPTLIGRLPNSSGPLPFGPYTLGQFAALGIILLGGYVTLPIWGGDRGLIVNTTVLGAAAVVVIVLMRKVPWRGRGPLPLMRGALSGYLHGGGEYRGRPTPVSAPITLHAGILIADDQVMTAAYQLLSQRQQTAQPTLASTHTSTQPPASTPASLATAPGADRHPTFDARPRPVVVRVLDAARHHIPRRAVSTPATSLTAQRRETSRPSPTRPLPARPGATRTSATRPHPTVTSPTHPGALSGVQRLRQQAAADQTPRTTTPEPGSTRKR